jgi:hypothetical protein
MVADWPICFSSVTYRTKALVDAGGIRPEEGAFGDLQLWMRMALAWDFGYVAKPLAACRIHGGTTTSNITGEHGVASDGAAAGRLHEQMRFQRRMDFLDEAQLEPHTENRLRASATLRLVAERASSKPAADLARLVRTSPRFALRAALWRVVVRALGGSRVRSALRRAARSPISDRRPRPRARER